ncbi:MAG: CaiB/BaiF CoA-transferase family protein [Chloroflexota bacterium]
MPGPLDGYKVVELAEGVAGPYAAMELGDGGADVVKVERIGGDRARGWGSSALGTLGSSFLGMNRNKRSVSVDIDTDEGAEVVRRLIADADVVIADAGWAQHPQLQPDALTSLNANLVYVCISEYGEAGPLANRPPYGELSAQLASEATTSLGVIGQAPVRTATDTAQMFAGIYSTQAVLAALFARDEVGGQRIDISLFGCLVALRSTLWVALAHPDEWWGFHLDSYVKPQDFGYACKDGNIYFSINRATQEQRDQLYRDLNMEWIKTDPQYDLVNTDGAGGTARYAHLAKPLWEKAFKQLPKQQVIDAVRAIDGWAFEKNTYSELVASEQAKFIGLIDTRDHPGLGPVATVGIPWEFADTPASVRLPAPRLGEHADEVLSAAGYSASDITALRSRGVLAGA